MILLTFSPFVYPQWKAGASYSIKSSLPENGFGVALGRNLPFQWPMIGLILIAEANLYRTNSDLSDADNPPIKHLKQTDIHINILGTFYPRYVYPYAGIGFGISSLTYEKGNRGIEEYFFTRLNKNYFFIEALTGIQLSIARNFYPFIEVHLVRYLTSFSDINNDISSLQFCWCFGLRIGFDTI